MIKVYLLFGSNLGEREQNIDNAVKQIEIQCGAVMKQSSLYETAPWGLKEQESFINEAIIIKTELPPVELLNILKQIEKQAGRTESVQWGPRVIDIDILFYGDEILQLPQLIIPHPFIAQRRFTLEPLNEISADFIHPVLKETIAQLLVECTDTGMVKRL